jgi:acetyl-CoA acetyltransferase
VYPSGGPLCGHPIMSTGLVRLGEVFRQLAGTAGARSVSGARRALAHASMGHCLQQNIVWVLGAQRRWS